MLLYKIKRQQQELLFASWCLWQCFQWLFCSVGTTVESFRRGDCVEVQ